MSTDIKQYLISHEISTDEKQLLFLMHCRMNETKCNYKTKYRNNINCTLWEENEVHLLQCTSITSELEIPNNVKYSDIFEDMDSQVRAVKIWKKIYKIRNWKLENRSLSQNGHQEHLLSASCTLGRPLDIDHTTPGVGGSTVVQNSILNVYDFG